MNYALCITGVICQTLTTLSTDDARTARQNSASPNYSPFGCVAAALHWSNSFLWQVFVVTHVVRF